MIGMPVLRLGKTGHDREEQLRAEISGTQANQHAGTENNRNKLERNHVESPLMTGTRLGAGCFVVVSWPLENDCSAVSAPGPQSAIQACRSLRLPAARRDVREASSPNLVSEIARQRHDPELPRSESWDRS